MKKHIAKLSGFILVALFMSAMYSCTKENITNPEQVKQNEAFNQDIITIPITQLTENELNELLFMREEEKLARDVYTFLYSKWQQNTFKNISNSEQQHMNSLKILIDKYSLVDPVGNNPAGVFNNPDLQYLYNSLIETGSISLEEALKVGASIEEIDIKDLDEAMLDTDNADFDIVYSNLSKASENHLRSFAGVLSKLGITYTPAYLSVEEYNKIVN
jgi:hypothetical protein